MRVDLESLRAYVTVLEWGSMARAAEQLELSASAMSWKIKRLEQRVGRPLLIRDGHDLRPTREGRLILEEAPAMLDAHDRLVRRLTQPEFSGTVKIGSNEEVGAARMAGILGASASPTPTPPSSSWSTKAASSFPCSTGRASMWRSCR